MKFSHLILPVAAFCSIAASAFAERNPTPPPSGIVIHLFGPNSIMSNITPDLPGETAKPAPAQPGSPAGSGQTGSSQLATNATGVAGVAGATGAAGTPATPQPADSSEPTMHDILHQLFVVGDPNHPTQPSTGRNAERPPAGN